MNKKTTRGAVAAVAGLGMVAVGMMPALTASAAPEANDSNEPLVSSEVTAQLEENGTADVWLELDGQADLSAAYDMSWEDRGHYVFNTLQSVADENQADVKAELDAAGADYQSFWINNSIFVQDATLDLVNSVASAESGVAAVTPDFDPELIAPVGTPSEVPAPGEITWGVEDIKAPEIWDTYGDTGEGIVVGTFDTGVEASHPALVNAYRGTETGSDDYNWFDSRGESDTPVDEHGHGTHVTGTMVGEDGDNQIGVAPGAQFIGTTGCCVTGADVLETFEWFVAPTKVDGTDPNPDMRPDIINNSWGFQGTQFTGEDGALLNELMGAWDAAGIFGTWSAGNAGEIYPQLGMEVCDNISSPSWNNGATYVVGNHQEDGTINPSSSRGPGEDGEPGVDIGAPGTDVVSAYPGGGYEMMTGTSMAAPHVAGSVALLWSQFPDLRGDNAATVAALDAAAIDQEDTYCDGDDANNPTWGEGDLDLVALFEYVEDQQPVPAPEVERIGGEQRYDTAALVSDQFGDDVETVYIATGENFPDAVSGAPAAAQGKLDSVGTLNTPDGSAAPVLLVKNDHPNNLPGDTRAALEEIAPANIVVLGGDSVISEAVADEIEAVAGDASVQRIEGDNRYDTAANMATDLWGSADTVFVASGEDEEAWSDALTGGALAGTVDAPVLLTKSNSVPETTANALESLGAEQVIVLGGPETIDEATYEALGGTDRLGGANKFETAAAVAGEYAADVPVVYVASANTYPDALTSSALAGSQDVPVVVVKGTHDASEDKIPAVIKDALKTLSPEKVVIVGGADAIDQGVEDWLNNPDNWQD